MWGFWVTLPSSHIHTYTITACVCLYHCSTDSLGLPALGHLCVLIFRSSASNGYMFGIAIMPKGQNMCHWLTLSLMNLCGKSCMGAFCWVHMVRLREGSPTVPCLGCRVGVTDKEKLCGRCGYKTVLRCHSQQRARAFQREFHRLAAIDISI